MAALIGVPSPAGKLPSFGLERFRLAVTLVASILVLVPWAPALAQAPTPGDFVINEMLADPAVGAPGDANGDGSTDAFDDEFIEIVNISATILDLSGLTLSDLDSVRHVFPAGTVVPPQCAVVVFGGGTPTGTFGGAVVQTATTGSLSLNNGGDGAILQDGATEIGSFFFGTGDCVGSQDQSVTLDPDLTGTCQVHTQATGSGGSLFSPGTHVDGSPFGYCVSDIFADGFESGDTSAWSLVVPTPPPIVINEIMQNPAAVSDTVGEWFELFNPGDDPVNIDGWTISDSNLSSHVISAGGSLTIPAGGFLVLGNEGDPGANGGVAIDYVYTDIALGNSVDDLILTDAQDNEIDYVLWDDGGTFPDPNGASMALADPGLDNSIGANWCESITPFGDGDLGTPGAANEGCP